MAKGNMISIVLSGNRFIIALAAERFVTVRLAEEHAFVGSNQTVTDVCQIAAMDADSVGLVHIVGYCHQRRHRTKRYALKVHIQTGTDNAYTTIRQLLAHIHDSHIEELCLVDTHDVDVIYHQEDVLTAIHRRGLDDIAVMRNDVLIAVTHIDGGLVDLHTQFRELSAFHTANEFLGFPTEHRSAYYFNRALPQTRAFGVSFRKHILFIQFNILGVHLEGGSAAIGVLLEVETDIDGFAILQMGSFVTLTERDTVHGDDAVGEIEVQMASVAHRTGVAVVDQMSAEERAEYGRKAKDRIKIAFSWEFIGEEYLKVWSK